MPGKTFKINNDSYEDWIEKELEKRGKLLLTEWSKRVQLDPEVSFIFRNSTFHSLILIY